ncbi:hypothetical protein ACJIZ3_019379 [Penstemon smallii]|uniref:Uncharacterized protein n=1 Tax=Penstemon smallii TaxID=265156 RepID=A0ABD3T147_9LAMI
MGTGWRRAFCTTGHKDRKAATTTTAGSNPSTPRLRCKTTTASTNIENSINDLSPNIKCKTTPKSNAKSPISLFGSSNPSSPRSPFSILKNTLRLSRSSCGVCMQSLKTGQRMAIYTAECSHTFHFPCITSHVKKQNTLICPVCTTTWKDDPLLASHKQNQDSELQQQIDLRASTKQTPTSSPKYCTRALLVESKSYADDEPLVTPKAVPKFNETVEDKDKDEEDEEEVEEFRGFFVDSISSSDEAFTLNKDLTSVDVSLLPEAAVISIGQTHATYAVVLKVKAPPPIPSTTPNAPRRAPIDLVTVLDVRWSMSGAKLEMLKRAIRLVISSLGSSDRLSIVIFSATPKRLLPLTRMTPQGQRVARRIIDGLTCSQGTSMGEALKQATKILEERRERNPVASIILLSDGQDDTVQSNNQRPESSSSHNISTTRFAHVEIPVHSSDFIREPTEDAFSKCVGELLSVVVQDLRIQLGFSPGSDPGEITAVYSCNGSQPTSLGLGYIRIGDLYAEEERELLVEMSVPISTFRSDHHHVFSIKSCYMDPNTHDLIHGREHALLVPKPQTVRLGVVPKIERLRNVFICTRAIAESRRLIEHNEVSSAVALLSSARELLMQSRSESAGEYVRELEVEIMEVQQWWRRQYQRRQEYEMMIVRRRNEERETGVFGDEFSGEQITPRSSWRSAEKQRKAAQTKNYYISRVSDLHGFENARF